MLWKKSSADLEEQKHSAERHHGFWTHLFYKQAFINGTRKSHTVLSVNEYTPFEKYHFKQYLNEHKNHFQNVDKTKFNITSV